MNNNSLSRRRFLSLASQGIGLAIVSHSMVGCSQTKPLADASTAESTIPVSFKHGVASGDPTHDAIILWTRISPSDNNYRSALPVAWEVARDAGFTQVVNQGRANVSADTDYTLKVDAIGLEAGMTYYYRFSSGRTYSDIGQTRTLPQGVIDSVKLAVFSCSNYPAGFFNVYDLASKQAEFDAVLHLGDYIYEYGRDGYATENAARLGREVLPEGELLTLSDYRMRYAQYRGDASLQKLHSKAPFICVWDDHEVANDTYTDGAQNHQEDEGSFEQRKLDALQAYFEWMPIRPVVEGNNEIINRSFQFGNLVDLFMLDTRIVGRDKQLEYEEYMDKATGVFDTETFTQDVANTDRTLLGNDQKQWLLKGLAESNGVWQVLGQQVLMGRMLMPAAVVTRQLSTSQYGELAQLALMAKRVQAKDPSLKPTEIEWFKANHERLTPETLALLQLPNIPYNLDAWDGYAAERESILGAAKQLKKNLVVVAGDTHNAWANNIHDRAGDTVAVEFATPGVSSPGLETYLNLSTETIAPTEAGLVQLVEGLQYVNASDRGFMTVTFTEDKVVSKWHFVDTVLSTDYTELTDRAQLAQSHAQSPGIYLS